MLRPSPARGSSTRGPSPSPRVMPSGTSRPVAVPPCLLSLFPSETRDSLGDGNRERWFGGEDVYVKWEGDESLRFLSARTEDDSQ